MDKTLTTQFILWLGSQEIHLYREDTSWVNPDMDLPGLMERFIDEWFAPAAIRERNAARTSPCDVKSDHD